MAKATITFSDAPDGTLDVSCRFKPDLVKGQRLTAAQQTALEMIKALHGDVEPVGEAIEDWADGEKQGGGR